VSKGTVCTALLFAFAMSAPAVPVLAVPAPLPTTTPSAAPASLESEARALENELTTLRSQTPRNEARISAITARLSAIAAQRRRNGAETGGVATKTTITNAELEATNAQNTYEAIKNVPGVTQADSSAAGTSDNLQIRGIKLASNTGYRLDGGLPIVNNIILSTEDKAQVQVLKGAGALEYGLASPAGIVNYILKRAGRNPVNAVSLSTNGYGQLTGDIDLARRFGSADQVGLRLNLAGGDTGSFIAGAGGTRYLGSLAGDWTTKKVRVRLDAEQFGVNVVEQAALLLNKADKSGHIALPRLPDARQLLSGDWDRSVGMGGNTSLRADYEASDGLTISAEAGESTARRARRGVAQIGTINLASGAGTETVSLVRDQTQFNHYANVQAALKAVNHSFSDVFTFGITRDSRDSNNPVTQKATYQQNIYNPVTLPAPLFPSGPIAYQPQTSVDYDYFFQNSAVFLSKVHVDGGLRQINYNADAVEAGQKPTHTKIAFLAPAAGIIVDMSRYVSGYASYVRSLEETPLAPINAANSLALLPPEPSTQREIGIRANVPQSYSATLAYFFIERANATIDPITNIFGLNGTYTFQGLESSANVTLSPKWNLNVGGQFMHALQHSIDDPTINGKIPENTPRLSGNVGLTYRPTRGLSLSASALSVAAREVNPQDQAMIPSVTTYGFLASYAGVFNHSPMSVNLSIRNLTNRSYYSSVVNNVLGVAAPRTVSLSLRMTP
jgi:iron complex outermembrane receptor protein